MVLLSGSLGASPVAEALVSPQPSVKEDAAETIEEEPEKQQDEEEAPAAVGLEDDAAAGEMDTEPAVVEEASGPELAEEEAPEVTEAPEPSSEPPAARGRAGRGSRAKGKAAPSKVAPKRKASEPLEPPPPAAGHHPISPATFQSRCLGALPCADGCWWLLIEEEVEEDGCFMCGSSEDDAILLVCDGCERAAHLACAKLKRVPKVGQPWLVPFSLPDVCRVCAQPEHESLSTVCRETGSVRTARQAKLPPLQPLRQQQRHPAGTAL